MRLLDPGFRYVPSANTNVAATWRRFGYRPTTDAERRARQSRTAVESIARVAGVAGVGTRAVRRRALAAAAETPPTHLRLAVSD
jgi:hypothetical protein